MRQLAQYCIVMQVVSILRPVKTIASGIAPATPRVRHLLSIADLEPDELAGILDHALELKAGRGQAPRGLDPLAGQSVGLLFDKPSLRTRVSFEVGIARLGGTSVSLTGNDVGLGSREPLADIARTLSRYVDAIVVRIIDHESISELAAAAGVPLVNALTEREHPCQALADLLTLRESLGRLDGRQLTYIGDGNNVCHSLLLGGAAVGLHVKVATPRGYEPDASIVQEAILLGLQTGARIEVLHDPRAAVEGAEAVYTDVWTSMGSEDEADQRRRDFEGFRVTSELLRAAPDALVMHCLPAHRGEEIDADVIDGPRSVVFDQAENRLYVQQAVLLHLLAARRPQQRIQGLHVPSLPPLRGVAVSAR
jgi:ornithine carbamoyltransferase